MATELGLSNEDAVQTVPLEVDRSDVRQTWWNVVLLDIISSWSKSPYWLYEDQTLIRNIAATGNPTSVNLSNCTTTLPSSSFLNSDPATPPTLPFLILNDLLGLRDNLIRVTNFNFDVNIQSDLDRELQ